MRQSDEGNMRFMRETLKIRRSEDFQTSKGEKKTLGPDLHASLVLFSLILSLLHYMYLFLFIYLLIYWVCGFELNVCILYYMAPPFSDLPFFLSLD